jgi:exodeoxyribonuclease VII large subunit
VRDFLDDLDDAAHRVVARARARSALARRDVDDAARRLAVAAPAAVARERARLDGRRTRVVELGRRGTRDASAVLAERERAVVTLARHHLGRAELRVDAFDGHVRALDPRRVLERGYSITRAADGRVVRGAGDTEMGAELVTELADGHVTSRVEAVAAREDDR